MKVVESARKCECWWETFLRTGRRKDASCGSELIKVCSIYWLCLRKLVENDLDFVPRRRCGRRTRAAPLCFQLCSCSSASRDP